ncbi:MAG: ROK family protein [Chloroflexi bacterium]|nr:ROK family protein [Chloroflexota bacterium]
MNRRRSGKNKLPVLAIDVGGTKIVAAIVSSDGKIMARQSYPTLAYEGLQVVIGRITSAIDRLLEKTGIDLSQLHGISLAAAGAIDSHRGIITLSPNLPGWRDVPLRDIIFKKYGAKTFLVHDATAAALGEHRFGAGKGVDNLIYVTVSTGIGGGIIIGGKLYEGTSGSAGEVGHMTIDIDGPKCNCGNYGCLEMFASGTAVAREAARRIHQGETSSLVDMVKGKLENITAEMVDRAAQNGDSLAKDVLQQALRYLGIGMASLVNILNPEMIVFGGGMSRMGARLLEPVRQVIDERDYAVSAQAVRLVTAKLGGDAEAVGAAVFGWEQHI